jgi:alpha-tubulin suppressor-like RCC1 family protein
MRTTLLALGLGAVLALMAVITARQVGQVEAVAAPAPKAVEAGGWHTCVLTAGGGVKCWGENSFGQLGDGTSGTDRLSPVDVCASGSGPSCEPLTGVTAVSPGLDHTCALIDDGTVRCWGSNLYGKLGDGTTTTRVNPVVVCASGSGPGCPPLTGVVQISASQTKTCAVIGTYPNGGAVKCWGADYEFGTSSLPFFVCESGTGPTCSGGVPLFGAKEVAVEWSHACALLHTGQVRCWGGNFDGQLGDGTTNDSNPLTTTCNIGCSGPLTDVAEIDVGGSHSCALLSTGKVVCWGENSIGQIGDGTFTQRLSPVQVCASGSGAGCSGGSPLTGAVTLDLQSMGCVVHFGTGGLCWGDGAANPVVSSPANITGFTSLTVGADHRCGLLSDGTVWCWGENGSGQVGVGTTESPWDDPVMVRGFAFEGGTSFTGIGAQGASCGRLAAGGLKCWGLNWSGQGGYGTYGTTEDLLNPVDVCASGSGSDCPAAGGFTQVAPGLVHTCALTEYYPYGGAVQCWGDGSHGQLGDGMTYSWRASPGYVCEAGTGPTCTGGYAFLGFKEISSGRYHTCGLRHDGTVWCWGGNFEGQLGNISTTDSGHPVQVCADSKFCFPLAGVIALSSGHRHTCALLSDGTVRCWGDNWTGQLGDGTSVNRSFAQPVCNAPGSGAACTGGSVLSGVIGVTGGGYHSCGLLVGSIPVCWGNNSEGQLGDGTTVSRVNPVTPCAVGSWNGSTCAGGGPLDNIEKIEAGYYHTCALAQGVARCWGDNFFGAVGDGTSGNDRINPVVVCSSGSDDECVADLHLIEIAAAGDIDNPGFTCAMTSAGRARCWGLNANGNVGDGTTTNRSNSVEVDLNPLDSDGDGCGDLAEVQEGPLTQASCGQRDPKNPYDYFNPTGDGENRIDDVLMVIGQYYIDDLDANPGFWPYTSGYNPNTDRTDNPDSSQPWDLLGPNGQQRIDDVLAIIYQYFHDGG